MAGFIGMDPVLMRGVARRMQQQAAVLDQAIVSVQHAIDQAMTHWDGEDARGFNGWWTSHYRPAILTAHATLVDVVAMIERNVAEQEHVSGFASECLAFAQAASIARDHALPPGWRGVTQDEMKKLGLGWPFDITGDGFITNITGMNARLATDGHGNYVLTFEGSRGSAKPDLAADWLGANLGSLRSGFGQFSPSLQVASSILLAQTIAQHVGASNLTLVGHSLGGRQAAVASVATGSRAVTFNAAGATDEDIAMALVARGEAETLGEFLEAKLTPGGSGPEIYERAITNYVTSDDPLTAAQETRDPTGSIPDALGSKVVVENDATNALEAHGLEGFKAKI